MDTLVRTPQLVFMPPQRLIVPLFQRPYVWNQESQWEPLWNDIVRVTERLLRNPDDRHHPHFLGAVVLQQVQNSTGSMTERTIIDGQQRLTTLQLFLDALHAELQAVDAAPQASRIETLVLNQEAFWERPEDRFKVWPTNRDRAAFNAVMAAELPVDYSAIGFAGARMVEAHRYFGEQIRAWLMLNGADDAMERASALERSVRELLQLVVIDLTADENAQEIFETLNARGAQLTAADLIKNFIFQRLLESGADVETAYEQNWKEFETGFWETEVSAGRVRYPRSSIFLNHWLIAKTGEEIVAREVFSRFKSYAEFDSEIPMSELVEQLKRASSAYQAFVEAAATRHGPLDRIGLFAYRTSVLESEVVKPVLLYLLDAEQTEVPLPQLTKALDVIESWLVRRMLVRATTKAYNQLMAELITQMRKGDRAVVGDVIEEYLRNQEGDTRYWPDDDEVVREVRELVAYRRLRRARLRMLLEAIEDYRRGFVGSATGLGGERVPRHQYAIEHVMPRQWTTHWFRSSEPLERAERDRRIHTLGNLTLLTHSLNSKVSNGPWAGDGKRVALQEHDVLIVNRDLLKTAGDSWTDDKIDARTLELAEMIVRIWPVPEGHRSNFGGKVARARHRVELSDLIGAGMLDPGATLYARPKALSGRVATLLPDGRIDVDGKSFGRPSEAATVIAGHPRNGWAFFLLDPTSKRDLRAVRRDYVDQLAGDFEDEELSEDDDD